MTTRVVASEVTITQIKGQLYPPSDVENSYFSQYFQTSRDITVGSYIYLSNFLSSTDQLNSLCGHKIINLHVYPYKVHSICTENTSDKSLSISVSDAFTSKTKTKVALKGFATKDQYFHTHVLKFFATEVLVDPTKAPLSGYCTINIPISESSSSMHFAFTVDFSTKHWCESLSEELTMYETKARQLYELDTLNDREVDFLRYLLPTINANNHLATSKVSHCPSFLVDCYSSETTLSTHDLEELFLSLSHKLDLIFLPIEARLLAVNRQKLEKLPLHSSSLSLMSVSSLESMLRQSGPRGCILYLQDWDLITEQVQRDAHLRGNRNANDTNQNTDNKDNSAAAQHQQHTETLFDIVCSSLLRLQQEFQAISAPAAVNPNIHSDGDNAKLCIMVAITQREWSAQQWQMPHSLCRQVFSQRWVPANNVDNTSNNNNDTSSNVHDNSEGDGENVRSGNEKLEFTPEALQLLQYVDEGRSYLFNNDDNDRNHNNNNLNTKVIGAAITEALQRKFGWGYLRDLLPTEEDLNNYMDINYQNNKIHCSEVHWQRLLHGYIPYLSSNPDMDNHKLWVEEIDIRRAFQALFGSNSISLPSTVPTIAESNTNRNSYDNSLNDTSIQKKRKPKRSKKVPKNLHIEPIYWTDIGGLDSVRQEILNVLELPLLHPSLFPPHAPRRQGVLLYGPPGTGKTLVAKAVATECNMSFLSVKGPELLDAYVGESEKNVRLLFAKALQQAPCVLFFDEIDSLAPARAKRNDSGGGVTDRIVSQLLTELDRVMAASNNNNSDNTTSSSTDKSHLENTTMHKPVFIIAATNRPDLLDPALLRPGRFDRKIYLGVLRDPLARESVFRAQTRKFQLAEDVNFAVLAREYLPNHVTGADIGAVSSAAYAVALETKLHGLETLRLQQSVSSTTNINADIQQNVDSHGYNHEDHAQFLDQLSDDMLTVVVTQADFVAAAKQLVPSVVDLSYYEELHATYDSTTSS